MVRWYAHVVRAVLHGGDKWRKGCFRISRGISGERREALPQRHDLDQLLKLSGLSRKMSLPEARCSIAGDQEILVKAFRKTAARLDKAYGPLALLLLIAPDEQTSDSWNVLVSAQGLDSLSRGEAIRQVSEMLRSTLNKSLWPTIARATVLRTSDPFVQAFTERYPGVRSGATLQAVSVSGVDLPKAVVVEANRQAA